MSDWKNVVASIAPTVASVLGGPVAGLAVAALGKALGIDEPTQDKIKRTLESGSMNGEQIAAIRQAEISLQERMRELDIDLEKIAAQDRDSARQRQIAVKDIIPGTMAIGVTAGFFGVLAWLLGYGVPKQGGEALLVMLGSLGTAWASIIAYYFGSSAGSAAKTTELAKLAGRP